MTSYHVKLHSVIPNMNSLQLMDHVKDAKLMQLYLLTKRVVCTKIVVKLRLLLQKDNANDAQITLDHRIRTHIVRNVTLKRALIIHTL